MKWISLVLIILFLGLNAVQYFENEKLKSEKLDEQVAKEIFEQRVEVYKNIMERPYTSELIFHAEDPKTKDFFTFLKIKGRGSSGYKFITDIRGIDREEFDLIYNVLLDSATDLNFAFENWFGESRIGANQKHRRNKDGSIDFGHFGQNYPKGTNPAKVGVVQQARDYVKHVNKAGLIGYPEYQRRSRYYSRYYWLKDLRR